MTSLFLEHSERQGKTKLLLKPYFGFTCMILSIVLVQPVFSQMSTQLLNNDISNWRLVTDSVMGGVSKGTTKSIELDNKNCVVLQGSVSTDNNGGFIQIAYDIDKSQSKTAAQYQGIQIEVRGNVERYNIHLRTKDLWFPWQAFRATFETNGEWQTIRLPFNTFEPYKTGETLKVENLKRIGVVAIGRNFDANICVASIGFYSEL